MSNSLIGAIVRIRSKLRIRSYSVPCTVCSMAVDAGCDDTCPLASIGLVLSHLLVKVQDQRRMVTTRTALGRCNMPTLKSHRRSLQSSPTLPNRYVLSSHRHGSKATADTQELCPWHLATILRSGKDQMVTKSS